uniref:Uncharacterized protein n=1 Tax=Physcomitrium patens TaxID=3218 RepID=A0A2K1KF03_PHYPA|nr:hypothetical protein PHYPA_008730 [Physcomitrium patens]
MNNDLESLRRLHGFENATEPGRIPRFHGYDEQRHQATGKRNSSWTPFKNTEASNLTAFSFAPEDCLEIFIPFLNSLKIAMAFSRLNSAAGI